MRKAKASILITIASLIIAWGIYECPTPITTLSYYDSRGSEVINIQTRLRNWGYYKGYVDGIYGYQTYSAVKYFQANNGLRIDGVAGDETLSALGIYSKSAYSSGVSGSYSSNANLLAHLVHGEARGEPYSGKVAVAAVVLNRIEDSKFPKTIPGVVYQPGAFTAVSDGQINLDPDSSSYNAARDALNGWDPTSGCIYYFNPNTATSSWIWSRPIVTVIGKHYFAK
ncbi:MAG: spore cortex-lytic enzyme [Ignavibacteriales bacterium]